MTADRETAAVVEEVVVVGIRADSDQRERSALIGVLQSGVFQCK